MTPKNYYSLGVFCGLAGMLFCAYLNNWIIIRFPSYTRDITALYDASSMSKKKVTLFFWKYEQWCKESTQILWSQETERNLALIIKAWLTLLEDEHLITTPVRLQSVLLSPNKTQAYLSFDRNLLPANCSIYSKWLYIEGLLKTIRENGIGISHIQLLVDQQPMTDYHLEFSNPWPINGFLS